MFWPAPLPRFLLLLTIGLLALGGVSGAPADARRAETLPRGVWPLQPRPAVSAPFDPPDSPFGRGHRGVDLAGRVGQQVHAALPGRVSFAGRLAGRGVVVVDHGPTRTTYEPVLAHVPVGTTVAAGAPIGLLELAGSHCAPQACLHWGWIRGETYLDPLELVGGRRVRLLPLEGGPTPAGVTTRPRSIAASSASAAAEVPLLAFTRAGALAGRRGAAGPS